MTENSLQGPTPEVSVKKELTVWKIIVNSK